MTHPLTSLPGAEEVLPKKKSLNPKSMFFKEEEIIRAKSCNACLSELDGVGVEVDVEELAKEMYKEWKIHTMNNDMDNWEILKNSGTRNKWRKLAQAIAQNPKILRLVKVCG